MKLKSFLAPVLFAGVVAMGVTSCKSTPKDEDVKAKVETAIANPAVSVAVKEGTVTLTGAVIDDAAKTAAEATAKAVENVKGVTNEITVAPPPPAPIVVSADAALIEAVNAAIKAFAGVKAEVKDGIVTLTGEVKKADLKILMPTIQALHPKKVENKLTVK